MVGSQKEINMLEGSLWDKILRFALPLAVTGILQQLFNAADIAVVGRFTGEKGALAMAAVGANTPVIGLILNLFIGISLGSNVIIAHAVGRRDSASIEKVVHTSAGGGSDSVHPESPRRSAAAGAAVFSGVYDGASRDIALQF